MSCSTYHSVVVGHLDGLIVYKALYLGACALAIFPGEQCITVQRVGPGL